VQQRSGETINGIQWRELAGKHTDQSIMPLRVLRYVIGGRFGSSENDVVALWRNAHVNVHFDDDNVEIMINASDDWW